MTLLPDIFRPLERYMLPTAVLRLGNDTEVASGNSRIIHAHPDHPGQLIKVPRTLMADGLTLRALRRRLRPSGIYKAFLRELQEYHRLARRFPQAKLPMPSTHGFVRTTLGIGLLVDAVRNEAGEGLAPTLEDLVSTPASRPCLHAMLQDLWQTLHEIRPSVGDLHAGNIVFGRYGNRTGLFIIDGLGRSLLFPIDLWSAPVNRWRLEAARDLLVSRLEGASHPTRS